MFLLTPRTSVWGVFRFLPASIEHPEFCRLRYAASIGVDGVPKLSADDGESDIDSILTKALLSQQSIARSPQLAIRREPHEEEFGLGR